MRSRSSDTPCPVRADTAIGWPNATGDPASRSPTSSSISFSQSTVPMEYNFEAGHAYRVGPESLFSRTPVLFDETQGVPVSAHE